MDRLASCPQISKREMSVRKDKPIKSKGLACPLPFSNDTAPHNEIDRLAQEWVKLFMDLKQESSFNHAIKRAFDE